MPDNRIKILVTCITILLFFVAIHNDQFKSQKLIPKINIESENNKILNIDNNIFIKSSSVPPKSVKDKIVVKPLISAEAYVAGNIDTGDIYIEHNSKKIFPIASISKLITALVAIHYLDKEKSIEITQSMLDTYGDAGHLVLGEKYTVSELLYPLLLESSNDSAEALAQSYGYEMFINNMNNFANMIGMNKTSFKDASGLNPENTSNASDLFILARYIYDKEKSLLDITKQTDMHIASSTEHGEHSYKTINPFPFDPHFIGGKTGRTDEAKESMLSIFNYSYASTTYPVAIIVLRADLKNREIDSSILFGLSIEKIEKGNQKR